MQFIPDPSEDSTAPAALSWMQKLTHVVNKNQRVLARRLGLRQLMRLQEVLETPSIFSDSEAALEEWAQGVYETFFGKTK